MNCSCGGWQFYDVAEIDGREGVVLKCSVCGKIERTTRETPLRTESMPLVAMGRVW